MPDGYYQSSNPSRFPKIILSDKPDRCFLLYFAPKFFMQKTILRFGLYGVAVMTSILLVEFFAFGTSYNWDVQEIVGYVTIILSLLFVFFGIRHWRDNYNGGRLTFGKGLLIGTLISLFPSLAFGVLTIIEMHFIDPDFSDKYYGHYVEKLKASTPGDKLPEALAKLEAEREMFSSPIAQFGFMFLTVFLIGIVITVISSLVLQRKNTLPERLQS